MVKRFGKILKIPVYPFWVAMFPVLNILTNNLGLTSLTSVVAPTLAVLLLTGIVWMLLHHFVHNRHKSGILASFVMLVFLTYGSSYRATDQLTLWSFDLHKHRYTMSVSVLAIVFLWWFLRKVSDETADKLSRIVRICSFLLLAMPLIILLTSYWQPNVAAASTHSDFVEKYKKSLVNKTAPDIYYFILDGYGREDILRKRLGFDNSAFTKELEKRGFYVAKESHANYTQTILSVTSSLNMEYLQDIFYTTKQPTANLRDLFRNNAAIHYFNELGYTTINTTTGYDFTSSLNTSHTITPAYSFSEFESAVYNNSVFPFFFENDLVQKFIRDTHVSFISSFLFEQHREKIKLALEAPRNGFPLEPGRPIMAFVHALVAHPPFVLGEEGAPVTPEGPFALGMHNTYDSDTAYKAAYIKGYIDQVRYGNKELLKTIDAIQSRKNRKSIIILQGDHGPWSLPGFKIKDNAGYAERMSILNAVYLPDSEPREQLYNEISPVNTFRLIFNNYFNAGFKLKEDKVFFSGYENKFHFKDITDSLLVDNP
ncbi:hypothetical protein [Pontibacter sp. H249]|uniref:hypothetical protein n=1 Tax=Pontibacter sp. H249 TaxID=3133420 RepID=UPI0030C4C5EA